MKDLFLKANYRIWGLFAVIIAIAIISLVLIIDNRINPRYKLSSISAEDSFISQIETNRQPSPVSLSVDLYLGNQKLIYDNDDNTFYYSFTEGENYYDLPLFLEHSTPFRKAVLGDKVSVKYIEASSSLVMYNKHSYSISNIVFTPLPIINIGISAETFAANQLGETYAIEEYAPGTMYLYDNRTDYDGADRSINAYIKIHTRGGTTLTAPQKSYRISLHEESDSFDKTIKSNLLGIRNDDDFILYAPYSDYEKVRNVFSMNLWHDMAYQHNLWNVPNSNCYKFVEVFFNGRYHGLYALGHPLDNKTFGIAEGEDLFKKTNWSPSEISQGMTYVELEGGGGFNWMPGYEQKAGEAFDTMHDLYMNLAYSGDAELIKQSIDYENAIDLWLFLKITQGIDNIYYSNVKNLYVAVKESSDGYQGHRLLFCPWDMDQSWGNRFVDGQGANGITSYEMTPDFDLPIEWTPVYYLQLLEPEATNADIKARYYELRQSVLSDDNLKDLISEYEAEIYDSGAFERTMNRWSGGNYYEPSIKLDDFEAFVLAHMSFMDDYINGLQ